MIGSRERRKPPQRERAELPCAGPHAPGGTA